MRFVTRPDLDGLTCAVLLSQRETVDSFELVHANIGIVMSLYGGGGQPGAGACVLPAATADTQIPEIVAALKRHA